MAGKVEAVDADFCFRIFTACPHDIVTIVIDVRPHKEFKLGHIAGAFSVRLSTNGAVLADYSSASYHIKWSQDCWWGRNVLVYGDSSLRKDHPVIKFLATQAKCRALSYYRDGFDAFARAYPFLATTSIKSACLKKYPSQILPKHLYLGDWEAAADTERLEELQIRRILTIHNHPENLRPPPHIRHLRQSLPDIEDANISAHFAEAFDFIDEGRERGQAVLVHCGAGVSRSATLVMMYLMRRNAWSAARAREAVVGRRSMVAINDGFWGTLCALEGSLGIAERSDPTATSGFRGADAPEEGAAAPVQLSKGAAGERVAVRMLAGKELAAAGAAGPGGKRAREGEGEAREGKRSRPGPGPPSFRLLLEVRKPEGCVGQLCVGPMRPSQRLVLGRSPECDVVLEHASVSRQHAALTVDRTGAVLLTDLQSGHGTKLGDTWLKPNAPRQLQPGAAASFGASTRTYKLLSVTREEDEEAG